LSGFEAYLQKLQKKPENRKGKEENKNKNEKGPRGTLRPSMEKQPAAQEGYRNGISIFFSYLADVWGQSSGHISIFFLLPPSTQQLPPLPVNASPNSFRAN
jgi:hypothetical protein